jgi:hypothetical protein
LLAGAGCLGASEHVVGQGIGGVKLRDTETQVEKAIGPPGFQEHFEDNGGITIWKYPKGFRA